jgi:hypothetical protein
VKKLLFSSLVFFSSSFLTFYNLYLFFSLFFSVKKAFKKTKIFDHLVTLNVTHIQLYSIALVVSTGIAEDIEESFSAVSRLNCQIILLRVWRAYQRIVFWGGFSVSLQGRPKSKS